MHQKPTHEHPRPIRPAALSAQVIDEVAARGHIADYHDGACIHLRGDGPPRLSVVLSGGVRLSNTDASGRRIQIATLSDGEMFGIHQVIAGAPYTHDAFASGETRLANFDRPAFDDLVEANRGFRNGLLAYLSDRLVRAVRLVETERRHPLLIRLAHHLYTNRRPGSGVVTGSQAMLAEALGVSRNALGGCLQRLAQAGLISIGRAEIVIPSPTKLANWIQEETAKD